MPYTKMDPQPTNLDPKEAGYTIAGYDVAVRAVIIAKKGQFVSCFASARLIEPDPDGQLGEYRTVVGSNGEDIDTKYTHSVPLAEVNTNNKMNIFRREMAKVVLGIDPAMNNGKMLLPVDQGIRDAVSLKNIADVGGVLNNQSEDPSDVLGLSG